MAAGFRKWGPTSRLCAADGARRVSAGATDTPELSLKVSVFGLGYVGAVMAACLVRDGHEVVGVDVNPDKVELVATGCAPFIEPGLAELLAVAARSGQLSATVDWSAAAISTDVSLVCVGTPSSPQGEHDLSQVMTVCEQIAGSFAASDSDHVLVLRSTVPPGTLERCREVFRARGCDGRVHCAFNPEFLREGSAISDYDDPPYTIIGTDDPIAERAVRELYAGLAAPVVVVAPGVAELVKSVANAWHATKITFANEVDRLARAFSVDGAEVMDVIARDTKLNVSAAYMKPGYAYGGSCLPKDVRNLVHHGRRFGLSVPLLESLPASNHAQVDLAIRAVLEHRPRRVLICGLAFKDGTDDLRESPSVPLVRGLLGEGCEVRIFDPAVRKAHLMGTNLAYIREHVPEFETLLVDGDDGIGRWPDLAVVAFATQEFAELLARNPETPVLDLSGQLGRTTRQPRA